MFIPIWACELAAALKFMTCKIEVHDLNLSWDIEYFTEDFSLFFSDSPQKCRVPTSLKTRRLPPTPSSFGFRLLTLPFVDVCYMRQQLLSIHKEIMTPDSPTHYVKLLCLLRLWLSLSIWAVWNLHKPTALKSKILILYTECIYMHGVILMLGIIKKKRLRVPVTGPVWPRGWVEV